jgi:ribonuclease M5
MEKYKVRLPIIVEGRYDKAHLSSFLSANIITTGGFGIFKNKEKQALIKRLARDGIILLCDSDGGGRQIRSFLSGILPKDRIYNLYTPEIKGKERRKTTASKAGLLGVEGIDKDKILKLLSPFIGEMAVDDDKRKITPADLFSDGISGGENSSLRREQLCRLCELPHDMTAKALLEMLNLFYSYEEYRELVDKIR